MPRHERGALAPVFLTALLVTASAVEGSSQTRALTTGDGQASANAPLGSPSQAKPDTFDRASSRVAVYIDPNSGLTTAELVRRALGSNTELAAARLDVDRARARLGQAGLRPNPTVELEHGSGRIVGNPGERETSVGVSIPLEVGGQRGRRVDLAEAEIAAAEAEVADRERRLAAEVSIASVEALAAARELETYERLAALDVQTARIVEARINEGESAPLDLNLIRVEFDRLRAEAALAEGRLQASMLRLRSLAGIPPGEALSLRQEPLPTPASARPSLAVTKEQALEAALRSRPDLRAVRLRVAVAQAGLRLAEAEARPQVALFGRYMTGRSVTDLLAPFDPVPDRDRQLAAGVAISLPVFNRNQGARAEAGLAITQAERRLAFAEAAVHAEVESAYARYLAARRAVDIYEQGVLVRSNQNVTTIREAYQLGVFRVTDLLAEQRRLVDAERDYTAALAEVRRALTDLQAAMGVSPVDIGLQAEGRER
jgi:cobalt-zinc-cadmium efflux system outer membrane protein